MVTRAKALAAFVLLVPALCRRAGAQTGRGNATLRKALLQRELWGAGYPLLLQTLGGWSSSGETSVLVAPDVIIGGTPYRSPDEAKRSAARFQAAYTKQFRLAPAFRGLAAADARTRPAIAARRFGFDGSYRVVVSSKAEIYSPKLTLSAVRRVLGPPEQTKVLPPRDDGGESRPLELVNYVYAGGALVYQGANIAPTPDSVFRIVVNTRAALNVMEAQ